MKWHLSSPSDGFQSSAGQDSALNPELAFNYPVNQVSDTDWAQNNAGHIQPKGYRL